MDSEILRRVRRFLYTVYERKQRWVCDSIPELRPDPDPYEINVDITNVHLYRGVLVNHVVVRIWWEESPRVYMLLNTQWCFVCAFDIEPPITSVMEEFGETRYISHKQIAIENYRNTNRHRHEKQRTLHSTK